MTEFESNINTLIEVFLGFSEHHSKGKKVFVDAIESCKTIEDLKTKTSKLTQAFFDDMAYISLAIATNFQINKELNKTIEKILDELPEDMHKLKTELKSHINEFLVPISEKLKEGEKFDEYINKLAKEREGRAKDLYG